MQQPAYLPVSYIFSILAFIGFVFNYTVRININLVITSMVNHTALNQISGHEDGPFVWDSVITGDILGIFYAGYMVFQMPGGRMAEVFGGKKVFTALYYFMSIHLLAGACSSYGRNSCP